MTNFVLSYAASLNKEIGELAFNNGIQKCADSGRVPYGYVEAVNKAHSMTLSFKPSEFISQVNMLTVESIKDARGKAGFVGGCLFQIAEALFNSPALKNPPQLHPVPDCFNAEKLLAKKQASADKSKATREAKKEKEKEEKANALNEELAKEGKESNSPPAIDSDSFAENIVNAIHSEAFELEDLQRIFNAAKFTLERIAKEEKEALAAPVADTTPVAKKAAKKAPKKAKA